MFTASFQRGLRHRRCARHWACVLALGAGSALLGLASQAQPVLTLDRALQTAQDRSRQLVAQDAAAAAARDLAIAAGQLPDPVLKAGINNLPLSGADRFSLTSDFMTARSVGVMQQFTRETTRTARAARFERQAEAEQAGRRLALANLQRDTARAWLDRHYRERVLEMLARQRDEARLQIDAAEAAYRGARGSQADVFEARSALAQIDDRIAQARRQVDSATIQLARWVGDAAAAPLGDLPVIDRVRLQPADLEAQFTHHPQLVVMEKQEQVAQAEAQVARMSARPDWSVELMFDQRGPAYSNMISVNVSVPLRWDRANRQDREIAAKQAVVERLQAEREEVTRAQVAEAKVMLQEWQSNRERLRHYDKALLPLAGERTQATLSAYRGGGGTLASVLEARRNEIDTRIERIRLEMETARLWAQLEFLMPAGSGAAAARP
ncbi:MAG: TolC family protein [Burkholderiaceae bacterium]